MRTLIPLFVSCLAALSLASCAHDCTPESCPDGCCKDDGVCYIGQANDACGLNGNTCQSCSYGSCVAKSGTCCVNNGGNCKGTADCCDTTSVCRTDGTCGSCVSSGSSCSSYSLCCSGLLCRSDNKCGACVPKNSYCGVNHDCCSGNCSYDSSFGDTICK
jgi:hypothetical protein